MDRQRIENEHIVARYLAGNLNAADTAAFEDYYTRHPEVLDDIEHTLRMREGLAVLEERGELERLIRARPRWHLPAAFAAALTLLVLGVWGWRSYSSGERVIAGTVMDLREHSAPPVIASTHVLARVRSASAGLAELPRSEHGALELRMMSSVREPGARFRVLLIRVDSRAQETIIGEARTSLSAEDGLATAYLDTSRLEAGRYVIELVPENAPAAEPERFPIELR